MLNCVASDLFMSHVVFNQMVSSLNEANNIAIYLERILVVFIFFSSVSTVKLGNELKLAVCF